MPPSSPRGIAGPSFLVSLVLLAAPAAGPAQEPPETVSRVDLERYAGLWYEYARLPNDFQDQCVADVTAEYTLRKDGRIDVVNRCATSEGEDVARGVARVVDAETNAELEVSFVSVLGLQLFWSDYWVLGLGDDYEWAVVGQPDREYGWLLVRDPEVSDATRDEMFFVLESNGYRHQDFVITPHR